VKLQDSYELNITQAERFLRELDESYAKSVAALTGLVNELAYAVEELRDLRIREGAGRA
jgi:hypothetical protein